MIAKPFPFFRTTLPPLKVILPKFSTTCHVFPLAPSREIVPPSTTQTALSPLRSAAVLPLREMIWPLLSVLESVRVRWPLFRMVCDPAFVTVRPFKSRVTSLSAGMTKLLVVMLFVSTILTGAVALLTMACSSSPVVTKIGYSASLSYWLLKLSFSTVSWVATTVMVMPSSVRPW